MSIVDTRIPDRLETTSPMVRVGAKVAVRNRYLGTWSPGFEIVARRRDGYVIRRSSDGAVFEEVIAFGDVRTPFGPPDDGRL